MDNAAQSIAAAPLPTKKTLRQRRRLSFQLWRFLVLNTRIFLMVLKGSH
jgi:hypothetical protein